MHVGEDGDEDLFVCSSDPNAMCEVREQASVHVQYIVIILNTCTFPNSILLCTNQTLK